MITAIDTATTILDCNANLRDLCSQLQRKSLSVPDFVRAFKKHMDRADSLDLRYFPDYGTFAPAFYTSDQLERFHSTAADLFTREELQEMADLLRSGTVGITEHQWQLNWHFLLQRGADLGIFWNSEKKRFN